MYFGGSSSSSSSSIGGFNSVHAQPGIRYAFNPPSSPSLSPSPSAVFSHQIYHDYNLQYQPTRSNSGSSSSYLGSGALIPISYGSGGSGSSSSSTGYPSYFTGESAHAQVTANRLSLLSSSVVAPHHHHHHNHHLIDDVDVVEPYYYHGDRILKQYLVSEKSKHDLLIDSHLGNPFQPRPILRYETRQLPFGGIVDVPVFATNDLEEDRLHPFKPSTLRKNHGHVALGSGSLGLISLANGNVYLGSGSLGYVSEKQHVDTLIQPTQKPFLVAGPTQFGTN